MQAIGTLSHQPNNQILVIGHRNPDTDAATASMAYATFLNKLGRYPEQAQAVVPGPLTPQAQWVFEYAGGEPPQVVESLAVCVRDMCRTDVVSLRHNQTLGCAGDLLIRSGHTMLPILDENDVVVGVFSHRDESGRMLIGFDVTPLIGSLLNWKHVLAIPDLQIAGELPQDAPCGSMHILLQGGEVPEESFLPNDLVICGNVAALESLPDGARPRRAIIVGQQHPTPAAERQTNRAAQICEIHYSGTVSEFLRQLNRCIPLKNLHFPIGPCVGADDAIQDITPLINSCRRALPVIDSGGRLFGVVANGDLLNTPKRRAVLVDHFENSQLAPGLRDLEILEIVDHHRIGDIQTLNPVRVDCRPIGSSCSIVALNYFEHAMEPDKQTARLLLGGLCADTLGLSSPTTTAIDHQIAKKLATAAETDLDQFVLNVLRAGDDLHLSKPADIWNRDQKLFSVCNRRFAVAQLETVSLEDLSPERLDEFRRSLVSHFSTGELLCSLLFITDVLKSRSIVTICESAETGSAIAQHYSTAAGTSQKIPQHWIAAPGVVSRKKQIIPSLMRCLAELPQAS